MLGVEFMMIVAVVNTKGGTGKSTIATHLAAHFANKKYKTGLADLDRQKSSKGWLDRRPDHLAPISYVDLESDKPLKKLDRLVVDVPAALRRSAVADIVDRADVLVIPVLPSAFDEDGTRRLLKHLETLKTVRKGKRDVCFVANRVKLRARSRNHLEGFLEELPYPIMAHIRDTQNYVNFAADGSSMFDSQSARLVPYQKEWQPLLEYLENCA